ncbi:Diaminopimelate decarboxylase [bacterium HR23]|nr:Diaminopimelate decarboxylase [bacterium HR23]
MSALEPLRHIFPRTAQATPEGHLAIGGCDVVDLAGQFGTPLYIFDEATLRHQCRAFRDAFHAVYPNSLVIYACKAYINPVLARIFQEEGLGLDVVSGGELAVARAVEFPPDRIYFHGNNKTPQELQDALDYRIGRVVVDNFQELALLEHLAGQRGIRQPILLRITPGVDPHTHAYTTTGVVDSKFGFPLEGERAREAVGRARASPHLALKGLHFHLGSPIFEVEPYVQAIAIAVDFAVQSGAPLEEFSPGGGFAIAYTREQTPPSPADYARAIATALREACARHRLPLPRLIVEPGRAIVGPSAIALYRVGVVKEIPGIRTYVAVDGGMGDNIRPALYGARYEAVCATKLLQPPTTTVTIAGKYCESGDILVRDALLPPVEPGDLIALPAAGAYCPSMASTYNLNGRPAIVLVSNGSARLIRRRETPQDLMALDVFP